MKNITCQNLDQLTGANDRELIKNFVELYYDKAKDKEDNIDHEVDMTDDDYIGYFSGLLMLEENGHKFKFIEVLNTRVAHSVPLFTVNFFTKIIMAEVNNPDLSINYLHYPMPLTAELEQSRDQMGNSLVIFFVAIAFSLIPANFVTIIVKEKLNNSKHLMRVSGISIVSYWIVNFIFELVKYYFTCGICLLLLWAFDFYKDYLYTSSSPTPPKFKR